MYSRISTFEVKSRLFIGGKSAVLSAITIALGGKAITTGRGSGLKNFIREGQKYDEPQVKQFYV